MIGDSRCPISDTWWQTETGGFMVCIAYFSCSFDLLDLFIALHMILVTIFAVSDYSPTRCLATEAWFCYISLFWHSGTEESAFSLDMIEFS